MSHTQGSWEFIAEDGEGVIVFSMDPRDEFNGIDICEMCCTGENNKEVLANARLICAAPEMLDVLNQAVEMLHEFLPLGCKDSQEVARGVIARAERVINNVAGNHRR